MLKEWCNRLCIKKFFKMYKIKINTNEIKGKEIKQPMNRLGSTSPNAKKTQRDAARSGSSHHVKLLSRSSFAAPELNVC